MLEAQLSDSRRLTEFFFSRVRHFISTELSGDTIPSARQESNTLGVGKCGNPVHRSVLLSVNWSGRQSRTPVIGAVRGEASPLAR